MKTQFRLSRFCGHSKADYGVHICWKVEVSSLNVYQLSKHRIGKPDAEINNTRPTRAAYWGRGYRKGTKVKLEDITRRYDNPRKFGS